MKRNIINITGLMKKASLYFVLGTLFLASCGKNDPNSPGTEFMPDMYRSPSLETNIATVITNADGTTDTIMANRMPVAGTIARGYIPYDLTNTPEGYTKADSLKNPIAKSDAVMTEAEKLYNYNCVHCHGATGQGDGLVGNKMPGNPPSYSTGAVKTLSAGKMFHSITYGKGNMGPHAQLLTVEERWKLVHFVQKLQNPEGAAPAVDAAKEEKKDEKKIEKIEKKADKKHS